ncbi:MAG: hypothetical protein GIS02_00390 [Methanosarcinales archaeon]|uniref:Uncharacterized protein n=1 Tax=Candidatus Ethanoperedens thermophilum TaxID=2766897 RepID=A0A848D8R1_9EURY|nr:hypothetical protein [Candidatus Ethanoperedens thermophilum]
MNRNRYIVGLLIFLMAVLSIGMVIAGIAEDLCTELLIHRLVENVQIMAVQLQGVLV